MKVEFAEAGRFSYWLQGFYAGCVHPDVKTEEVARGAWNAAIESAARTCENSQSGHGKRKGGSDAGDSARRNCAILIRELKSDA